MTPRPMAARALSPCGVKAASEVALTARAPCTCAQQIVALPPTAQAAVVTRSQRKWYQSAVVLPPPRTTEPFGAKA